MKKRLEEIFSLLPECETFADIGCDHGYVAKQMLESGKCKKVIISDVSQKCLDKAVALLSNEIEVGRATAVVSDGFEKVGNCDLALIAGMGGEEIVGILKRAKTLPEKVVLQPMKNTKKVRKTAVELGYKIQKDYTFFTGKIFYDLLLLVKGKDSLTDEEAEFGRTNLKEKPTAFTKQIKLRIKKLRDFLKGEKLKQGTKEQMQEEIQRLENYVEDK